MAELAGSSFTALPRFSVYGLAGDTFGQPIVDQVSHGGQSNELWQVFVGHGPRDPRERITVVTDGKLPKWPTGVGWAGPTGLADVARTVLLETVVLGTSKGHRDLDLIQRATSTPPDLPLVSVTIRVDSKAITASMYSLQGWSAIFFDLKQEAVGLYGPTALLKEAVVTILYRP